jgi:DNA-binding response OmpR family regulator
MTSGLSTDTGAVPSLPGAIVTPGVLVVDDDELVRSLLRSGLEWHGFRVWVAADGEEAVTVYRENRAAIAVVLLDVRMPGMDGPRTLGVLRWLDKRVVACFMSGNTGGYDTDDLIRRGARHVFAKPFCLKELAATLRSIVRARPLDPA